MRALVLVVLAASVCAYASQATASHGWEEADRAVKPYEPRRWFVGCEGEVLFSGAKRVVGIGSYLVYPLMGGDVFVRCSASSGNMGVEIYAPWTKGVRTAPCSAGIEGGFLVFEIDEDHKAHYQITWTNNTETGPTKGPIVPMTRCKEYFSP